MIALFDLKKINNYASRDKLPFQCEKCNITFYITAGWTKNKLKHFKNKLRFCSNKCSALSQSNKIDMFCGQCNAPIKVSASARKSKSGKRFCSSKCSTTYNNINKTTGTRRSKLEVWLQAQLSQTYKELEFHFNKKDAINSELDIYIPSLKLAFELNGIFHYEPIYGAEKLKSIKNNDNRKFQACLEKQIELVIIDVSSLKYFKEERLLPYKATIMSIIDNKLAPHSGVEPEQQL